MDEYQAWQEREMARLRRRIGALEAELAREREMRERLVDGDALRAYLDDRYREVDDKHFFAAERKETLNEVARKVVRMQRATGEASGDRGGEAGEG